MEMRRSWFAGCLIGWRTKENEQLKRLAQPVAGKFVKQKGRFSYVEHSVITQYLLAAVGPYDFQLVQVISDGDIITGAVCSLTCSIDGKHVTGAGRLVMLSIRRTSPPMGLVSRMR